MTSSSFPDKLTLSAVFSYLVPPLAASVAIVPAYYDMAATRFLQKGLAVPKMTGAEILKGGLGAMPTVGVLVGTQMSLQKQIEKALIRTYPDFFTGDGNKPKGVLTLVSATFVGAFSSPFLAVYNGKTMTPPWSVQKSWSKFSTKQAGAITLQETGFVAGLAAADLVFASMKQVLGGHKAVEYFAAAIAGACGSLAGHAGNTALTCWQNDIPVTSFAQLTRGALQKARGTAVFGLVYKFGQDVLNSIEKINHVSNL